MTVRGGGMFTKCDVTTPKKISFFNYSHRHGAKKTSSAKLLAAEDSPRYLQAGYVQSLFNICRKEQKKFVRPYREDSWV